MSIKPATDAETAALALAQRHGWPEELRTLLDRYPREVWAAHENLGQMCQFWLSRHNMFRELAAAIEDFFASEEIAYLHVHNAKPGCYAARVDRA